MLVCRTEWSSVEQLSIFLPGLDSAATGRLGRHDYWSLRKITATDDNAKVMYANELYAYISYIFIEDRQVDSLAVVTQTDR